MRARAHPGPRGDGQHDRGEQHDRGVQAEHRRGHRGRREDRGQQPFRAAPAEPGDGRAGPLEDPVLLGEVREDQDGREEEHGREQLPDLVEGIPRTDQAAGDADQRGGKRGDRLWKPARPGDGETEHRAQQHERDDRGHRRSLP